MKILLTSIGVICALTLTAQHSDNWIKNLIITGKYAEAAIYIDSLFETGIESSSLLFYAGKTNEELMRYNKAYRYYKKWYSRDTANQDAKLAMARSANLAGHQTIALKYYEQLSREDSVHFLINFSLGRLYQQIPDYPKAIQVYTKLLTVDSTNTSLLSSLGDCTNGLNLTADALSFYIRAFEQDKRNGRIALKAINAIRKDKKVWPEWMDTIIALADTAIRYNPNYPLLAQSRGILKYFDKRYKECDTIFTKLTEGEKVSRVTLKYYGLTLFQLKRFSQAEKWLAQADSLFLDEEGNHTDLDVALRYGEALIQTGNPYKALQIFREVETQLQPDNTLLSRISVMNGNAYSTSKENKKAVLAYWQAYKLYPANKQAIANLTYLCQPKDSDESILMSQGIPREKMLFTCILFLKNYNVKSRYTEIMQEYCREVLNHALREAFLKNTKKLTARDPEGKKYTYSYRELHRLANPPESPAPSTPPVPLTPKAM